MILLHMPSTLLKPWLQIVVILGAGGGPRHPSQIFVLHIHLETLHILPLTDNGLHKGRPQTNS